MVAPVVNSPSSCSPSAPNAAVRRAGWTGCSKVSTPSTAVLERVRVERCHIYLEARRHAGRMVRAMATRADGRRRRKVVLRLTHRYEGCAPVIAISSRDIPGHSTAVCDSFSVSFIYVHDTSVRKYMLHTPPSSMWTGLVAWVPDRSRVHIPCYYAYDGVERRGVKPQIHFVRGPTPRTPRLILAAPRRRF